MLQWYARQTKETQRSIYADYLSGEYRTLAAAIEAHYRSR